MSSLEKSSRNEALPVMNVLTNAEATMAAIEELEGGGWIDQQNRAGEDSSVSLFGVLKNIREHPNTSSDYARILYGMGGWNRYAVYPDGSVKFIKHFAKYPAERVIEKARQLGFEIM
jgi:hypothetical protein